MSDQFAEIRAILDQLASRLDTLEGPAVDIDNLEDLKPGPFDSQVAFFDGAASLLARYGARLRERGNVLSVRYLLGDIAWGIDWLVSAGALSDVDAWDAAAEWFEARATDAPDPVTMVVGDMQVDVLSFVSALERVCSFGLGLTKTEREDREGGGLTAAEAIKVVQKIVHYKLEQSFASIVERFPGDKVKTRKPWPVIQTLADYLLAEYQKMGEPMRAGSLGKSDAPPSNDPPPYSIPDFP